MAGKKRPKQQPMMPTSAYGGYVNPWAVMPNPNWGPAFNYTPYQNAHHQNAVRPGLGPWGNTNARAAPYHRNHPYGYVDPYQAYNRPHQSYPSTSVAPFIAPEHPKGKRKYPSDSANLEPLGQRPALGLTATISAQKIFLKWNSFQGRKDVSYTIKAVCTSSACNFQANQEGRQWIYDQTWTQTSKVLATTPGNQYRITVECRELSSQLVIASEQKEFKACMNIGEHAEMFVKAVRFSGNSMHPFEFLYRCKPKFYWDYIHQQNYDLMEKYIKDNNGQPSNQINGNIHGLFFSARLLPDGTLPPSSPFGDVRMLIHANALLNPDMYNFYFADFYCNYLTHYVTVVVCRKESETDHYCKERCHKINIFDNPFLKIVRCWDGVQRCYYPTFYVSRTIWVEIYYTENVHLNWGKFSNIIATGAGTSKLGGLPNNKQCSQCNLYPVKSVSETQTGIADDELDVDALDLTIHDPILQSSTFRVLCEQEKGELDEYWDDLVEVICSVVDGACELQEMQHDSTHKISSDPIILGNREIDQLIKDTEEEIGSSVAMTVVPQLREAWTLVKKYVEDFKKKLDELNARVATVPDVIIISSSEGSMSPSPSTNPSSPQLPVKVEDAPSSPKSEIPPEVEP